MMHGKGLTKIMEECGELVQVAAKFIAYPKGIHPDGKGPLKRRLEEEIADVFAACNFVIDKFGLDTTFIAHRRMSKQAIFYQWDRAKKVHS